ncbi:MAG: hypothetical protein WCG55_02430 [bacterium]
MQLEKVLEWGKYLPSKKFSIIIGTCIVVILAIFIATSYFGSKSSFNKNPGEFNLVSYSGTLNQAISQDSNNNGIPDWEESLWGLDPKGDGAANKKIIESKKAQNAIKTDDSNLPTPTDIFTREFMSTVLALRQSGNLTPDALTKVAQTIGNDVDNKHANPVTYSMSDLTVVSTGTQKEKTAYQNALKNLISEYNNVDLGSELNIISDSLNQNNSGSLKLLQPIAEAYISLAKKMVALKTPIEISQSALALANSTAEMGQTLIHIENLYTDTIHGMVSLDDYVKASDEADRATATISSYFAN